MEREAVGEYIQLKMRSEKGMVLCERKRDCPAVLLGAVVGFNIQFVRHLLWLRRLIQIGCILRKAARNIQFEWQSCTSGALQEITIKYQNAKICIVNKIAFKESRANT